MFQGLLEQLNSDQNTPLVRVSIRDEKTTQL